MNSPYRITFDNSNNINSWLTVERDTTGSGNSFTTLIPAFDVKGAYSGQAAIPANFYLSLTVSTGGAINTHEFDNLKACATVMLPVGGGIHHLEITSSNASGSTCQPITLTIKACANAACSGYTSKDVTGTLTANTAVTCGAGAPNFTSLSPATIAATTFTAGVATVNPAFTFTTSPTPLPLALSFARSIAVTFHLQQEQRELR
jgi:MSHA biogenesis protein MshQ